MTPLQTVLDTLSAYSTRDEAIAAARDMAAMQDVPRVCSWRDVERARREMKETTK